MNSSLQIHLLGAVVQSPERCPWLLVELICDIRHDNETLSHIRLCPATGSKASRPRDGAAKSVNSTAKCKDQIVRHIFLSTFQGFAFYVVHKEREEKCVTIEMSWLATRSFEFFYGCEGHRAPWSRVTAARGRFSAVKSSGKVAVFGFCMTNLETPPRSWK